MSNSVRGFYKTEYDRCNHMQSAYSSEHLYIPTKNSSWWNKKYQDALVHFLVDRGILNSVQGADLKTLHKCIDKKYMEFSLIGPDYSNNSRTLLSDILFEFVETQEKLYHQMLVWLHRNVIKKDFYFQKIPTIRVHMPDVKGNVIYPCWHADGFLGHNPRDLNLWFGLTDNQYSGFEVLDFEDSREWFAEFNHDPVEWRNVCFRGKEDFMSKGHRMSKEVKDVFTNLFLFDSRCIHSAIHRGPDDETTKISIDFRLLMVEDENWPVIDNKPLFVGTGIRKAEYRVGSPYGYYAKSVGSL